MNNSPYKRGDEVQVYHDPLTENEPEGIAILKKKLNDDFVESDKRTMEIWIVKFQISGSLVERMILRGNQV